MLLLEEAETYPIFSDADRTEFIFLIFKHICLGGQVCQVSPRFIQKIDILGFFFQDKSQKKATYSLHAAMYKKTSE